MALKTYQEWEPILEQEHKCKVYDPDGYRALVAMGMENDLITKEYAQKYFFMNTMLFSEETRWHSNMI
jgi:hypothetical protein